MTHSEDHTSLLEVRFKQFKCRDEKFQQANSKLLDTRQKSVDYWNKRKKTRDPLKPGDMVLV